MAVFTGKDWVPRFVSQQPGSGEMRAEDARLLKKLPGRVGVRAC